jgi:hypothetical protein
MRKFAFTLFIIIGGVMASAQQETDTLSAFADAEQEAEYQSFYAVDDDEEAMSRAIVQGGSSGKVNTRPVEEKPCKMWAILVADTYDESIGEDDAYDNLALNKELKAIAQCLGIEISITNITANRAYNKRNLADAITNLRPAANDIVFFCFNGHGFRWDDQKDMYPNICMIAPNADPYKNHVATTDIYNAIKNKGARLSVIITDCCNSKYGARGPRQRNNTLFSRSHSKVSKKRMGELFLDTKGVILATAAKPGEYAWSFEGTGSAFTHSFISQLRKEVGMDRTENPSWQHIIDKAIESARQMTTSCENTQHGMRYMSISKQ